ncbi:MAG TPA: hypothetical protein VG432_04515 [Gemmatimonadaceae bacterium]|nr:hypothetical protein [Gemmatimonadaceae bacterium]
MLKRLFVVMLAALAVACSDRLSVRVDTAGTVFDRAATIGSTVPVAVVSYIARNTGDKVAFLPACGQNPVATIERLNGGTWEQWSGGACLAIMPMSPIEMHAGNRVWGSGSIAEAGRFRLRLSYADNARLSGERFAFSEPFDVR